MKLQGDRRDAEVAEITISQIHQKHLTAETQRTLRKQFTAKAQRRIISIVE
jgi:hypothetical protein